MELRMVSPEPQLVASLFPSCSVPGTPGGVERKYEGQNVRATEQTHHSTLLRDQGWGISSNGHADPIGRLVVRGCPDDSLCESVAFFLSVRSLWIQDDHTNYACSFSH